MCKHEIRKRIQGILDVISARIPETTLLQDGGSYSHNITLSIKEMNEIVLLTEYLRNMDKDDFLSNK